MAATTPNKQRTATFVKNQSGLIVTGCLGCGTVEVSVEGEMNEPKFEAIGGAIGRLFCFAYSKIGQKYEE